MSYNKSMGNHGFIIYRREKLKRKTNKVLALLLALIMVLVVACTNGGNNDADINDEVINNNDASDDEVKEKKDVNIVALKGPTAMGLVKFMDDVDNEVIDDNNYNFNIVASPDEVVPKVINGEVDIACVPSNLASVLYNKTQGEIQALAINTLGVLYIVENGDTVNSISDLEGKTIYASGKNSTPEYALTYILEENNLENVNVEWKEEHTEALSAMLNDENGIALLPQPFVTTAQMKNEGIRIALNITEEWGKLQENEENPSALVMGVVIARKDFIEENEDVIENFLDHYEDSAEYVNENVDASATLVEKYDIVPEKVAQKAIPYCNIVLIEDDEMKNNLSGFLKVLENQNPESIGGKLPEEDFYYED